MHDMIWGSVAIGLALISGGAFVAFFYQSRPRSPGPTSHRMRSSYPSSKRALRWPRFGRFQRELLILILLILSVAFLKGGYLRQITSGSPVSLRGTMNEAFYRSCADARRAGVAPIYRGQPGYAAHLDADNDGVACEPWFPR